MFFLDYFATGKLHPSVGVEVLKGIQKGCLSAGCAIVGGETAEMPGFYADGEFDLAGFSVGWVKSASVLPKKVSPGDVLIGLSSSGFHSNGYSLLRKILASQDDAQKTETAKMLLEPTLVYVRAMQGLLDKRLIKGASHITGSGFLNLPRISTSVSYRVEMPSIQELPPAIRWLRERKMIEPQELYQTFNMGVGMILVVDQKKANQVLKELKRKKQKAWCLGEVIKKQARKKCEIQILDPEYGELTLIY